MRIAQGNKTALQPTVFPNAASPSQLTETLKYNKLQSTVKRKLVAKTTILSLS